MIYSPYIIDGILIIVLLVCAVKAYSDGFFTSVIKLVGNVGGLIAAWLLAKNYSVVIFDRFFKSKLTEKAFEYLSTATEGLDLQTAVNNLVGKFPKEVVDGIIGPAVNGAQTALEPTMDSAAYLVENFLGPLVIAIISVVIFTISLALIQLVVGLVSKAFKMVNSVPVLGFANRLAGFAAGTVIGGVNIILLSFLLSIIVIITGNSLGFLNNEILQQSKILALTSGINPFLT